MKKNILLWAPPLLLVLAIVLAYSPLLDDKPVLAPVTTEVQRGTLSDLVTATGILQPSGYVDVGAQVSGQLKIIHAEVGDNVSTGDLLAEIDPTVYLAQVDASRAQLRNQQAQLKDRQAQLTLARLQHRRQQRLMAENATSREAVQIAEATLHSAEAQVDALKAQIAQTESSLRADEANLDYARIYAPMDGTVVSIEARQGQTLNTNQQAPTLMRIADLATMTVQAKVSEADVGKLSAGMKVYFTTLGDPGRRWHSQLRRIEPTPVVENNVVLYNALFDIDNPRGQLMSQMTTHVFFVRAETENALLVPVSALRFTERAGAGKARSTVLNNGRKEEREVQVGISNRVQAEVLSGLEAGEQVILNVAPAGQNGDGRRSGMRIRF
ncbi:efflux RND transporter periplasmic adaptor subunit [Oceanimonas baumannii]|uniref:Efflux transporter periplasmic adaptor subunit n=1 Tax=Oceanimonas baumannii TaxID=129578 RepID=A0A235CFY9_9GAMM|nr:efflux RND transporter periplasmic adaptor subunit [Oceanimonas baumannii]OYD23376.1 efflux transporter periplasmic adaptor subunit [Oceanimonas baumannii]TDW58472.1 macrolide-specific efflux system membrane fusion protein [Oceanimonas baumannii]